MNKIFSTILFLALLGCYNSAVFAAELLDVKPVVSGDNVSIQILSDIAMTYTYYKVPGQARAVVDIAEADPEKVEPLIVVNKGVVSSISVDKTEISGFVVSRIIFNLVSEADISVTATPDRKLLTVTFGGTTAVNQPSIQPEPAASKLPEPIPEVKQPASATPAAPISAENADDPLGLDEPVPTAFVPLAISTAAASATPLATSPTTMRIPKLEPVVPLSTISVQPSSLSIERITTEKSYIEIRANQSISDYKTTRMAKPERLVIDIAAAKINQKARTISINKFGITKARIGISPQHIRIVLDSAKAKIPEYTIISTEDGLRINFK